MSRKTKSSAKLSRDMIVNAALRLIDEFGLPAFSMRKLAHELGVDPMSIYYYLPNKDAVLGAVVEHIFEDIALPDAAQLKWQERYKAVTRAYRLAILDHANLLPYLVTFDGTVRGVFDIAEALAQILSEAGFGPRMITKTIDMTSSLIAGCVVTEVKGSLGQSADMESVYAFIRELPSSKYPVLTAMANQLGPKDLEMDFEFKLDVLIAGLESMR